MISGIKIIEEHSNKKKISISISHQTILYHVVVTTLLSLGFVFFFILLTLEYNVVKTLFLMVALGLLQYYAILLEHNFPMNI